MKSGKALVVLFVSIQKTVRNPIINVLISFRQRKESLQCLSIVTWLLIDILGGKTPFSAFFHLPSLHGRFHCHSVIQEPVKSDPHFSASVSRSSIASKEKFKQLWVNSAEYHLQNKQKTESMYLVSGIEYTFFISNAAAPTPAGFKWKNMETKHQLPHLIQVTCC